MLRLTQALILYALVMVLQCQGQSYDVTNNLMQVLFNNYSRMNPEVRPLLNQSKAMVVNVSFNCMALVDMDDRQQQFIMNGFLLATWTDEITVWDPDDYDGIRFVHPSVTQTWRPRMILQNTLGDRDLFRDDHSPIKTHSTGFTEWFPGSIFSASCELNMKKFPFDDQECTLQIFSMGLASSELTFVTSEVRFDFYTAHGEWEILSTSTSAHTAKFNDLSYFSVKFRFRRRPAYFVINIMMPVVVISLLNNMVFLIPVDSGEKISYCITILLTLALFMSTVSDMMPRSSDVIPVVTIYLLILLVISVLTVFIVVLTSWIYHLEEKKMKRQKARSYFRSLVSKLRSKRRSALVIQVGSGDDKNGSFNYNLEEPRRRASALSNCVEQAMGKHGNTTNNNDENEEKSSPNRHRKIVKCIDIVSFVILSLVWAIATTAFFIITS